MEEIKPTDIAKTLGLLIILLAIVEIAQFISHLIGITTF